MAQQIVDAMNALYEFPNEPSIAEEIGWSEGYAKGYRVAVAKVAAWVKEHVQEGEGHSRTILSELCPPAVDGD
jgi:hypothetical protein